jgi:hypothetical protein
MDIIWILSKAAFAGETENFTALVQEIGNGDVGQEYLAWLN